MIFVYVGYAGKIYYDNFVLFSALTIIIKGKEIACDLGLSDYDIENLMLMATLELISKVKYLVVEKKGVLWDYWIYF